MKRPIIWSLFCSTALLASGPSAWADPNIYLSINVLSGQESDSVYRYHDPAPGSISTTKGRSTGSAQADYKVIRLLADMASTASAGNPSNIDFSRTRGDSADDLKIDNPALAGQKGFVTIAYQIDGAVVAQGEPDPNDPNRRTGARYFGTVAVGNATGVDNISFELDAYGRPNAGSDIRGQRRELVGEFTFGKHFSISWSLYAESYVPSFTNNSARADIQGRWIAVTKVTDASGQPINDYTISAKSGADFAPQKLWVAGRDLASNEKPDRASETNAVNETVPQWSYGFRSAASDTAFTPFPAEQHRNASSLEGDDNIEGFDNGSGMAALANVSGQPVVLNAGHGDYRPIYPGQMLVGPSSSNAFTVVRWTAPAAGRYNILARWLDLDVNGGNGISCHTVVNGTERFAQDVDNGGIADMPSLTVDLQAGEVVDFALGGRGDFSFDSTGFNAAISLAPAVEIAVSGVENGKLTVTEGENVPVTVTVGFGDPAQTVELRDNLRVVGRDDSAPYEFVLPNIESGTHRLQAVAIDARGVEGASQEIDILVLDAGSARRLRTAAKGGDGGTRAAVTGTTYRAKSGGNWHDPQTWEPAGVPGPGDKAILGWESTSTLVLDQSATVAAVILYNQSALFALIDAGPLSLTVTDRCTLTQGTELDGFSLNLEPGSKSAFYGPRFEKMTVANAGEMIASENVVADASTILFNTGAFTLVSPPASNAGTRVTIPEVQHNGGALDIAPGSKLITGSTLVQAPVKLISDNGSGILSDAAGGIISDNASSLISDDGSSLIGSDGASVKGPNNAPLIGSDGASLVGNGGNTLLGPSRKAAQSDTGSQAEATTAQGIVLGPGAVVSGRGNIVGNVTNQAGFISPGSSSDVIRILGNYTQEEQGTLLLEVGGTTANPPQFDQLQIRGAASLGGNLIVKTVDGFTPQSGDTFSPLTYNSVSGSFANISSNAQVNFGPDGMTMQVSGANPPAPKALNIATRMRVETGDNVLIAGFIVTGEQPKKVLVRGVGPSLPVDGALADPTLDLDAGAFFNDNWTSDQRDEIEATTIPPPSELESAIVATLAPGAHTAVLRGKSNGTGVGLVEVYDLESGAPAQLANISTRGQVQTGDNVMIGGFIIGGNYPAKVLLRAIGPSLPVDGALQDPTLELVDSNGSSISNDNWRETQEADILATTVPPSNDKEAAVVATLVPGAYTAVVRGKDDTIGVALVEGYNLQ